jgi:dipeptidyl aminopeptidase/acylaminoacyl peptidase
LSAWLALTGITACTLAAAQAPSSAAAPASAAAHAAASASASAAPNVYKGLGLGSIAPETLRQFAPRPLPEDTARRIQSVLDLRAPGAGLPSPDGRRLFFTWRVTGVDQVWRLDGPNTFPRQLTAGQDKTTVAGVSPDGRWLALQRDRGGQENPGLYLQPVEGGALKAVQHLPGVQTEFQGFSPDGRFLYYVANDRRRDSYAVYRHALADGRSEMLYDGQGFWRVGDLAAGRLLLVKYTGSVGREWSLFDEASRSLTPLLGQGEHEGYDMAFAPQAGRYFVSHTKATGFRRVFRWAPGQGFEPVALPVPDHWDVEDMKLDDARKRLYLSVNEAGYLRSVALDARTLQPLPLPWPAGAEHQGVGALTPDGERVVLTVSRPDAPRESHVYDWRTRQLTRWIVPSTPETDTRRYVPATLESYPAKDGTPIPMFVRRPPQCADQAGIGAEPPQAGPSPVGGQRRAEGASVGAGTGAEPPQAGPSPLGGQRRAEGASVGASSLPCPVLVHFHGGPEGQSKPGFSPLWQLFVDAGFIVVDPNVRGSTGYGKAWLDADNGPKRLQVLGDIEDAALYARKAWARNGVAPKVGVFGGSYGGYATLMAMTRFAGAYDAGVSVVGIANLLSFLENTAPYRRQLRVTEYGDPATDREALKQLSATTWVHQLKAPLMIIQGANDPRVPVGEALQMHEAAKARGVPLELMIFADEGHGASSRGNQALEYGHMLRFFQQHLQGVTPAPAASAPPAAPAASPSPAPAG